MLVSLFLKWLTTHELLLIHTICCQFVICLYKIYILPVYKITKIIVFFVPQVPNNVVTYAMTTNSPNRNLFFVDVDGFVYLRNSLVGITGDPFTVRFPHHLMNCKAVKMLMFVKQSDSRLSAWHCFSWLYSNVLSIRFYGKKKISGVKCAENEWKSYLKVFKYVSSIYYTCMHAVSCKLCQ